MKKYIVLILTILLIIPFIVRAEVCDTDKITIESITLENKSDNVEELNEATTNGKNIKVDLSMFEVGDNAEYNMIVKNDSNEDYTIDNNSLSESSDYIDYSLETEDNSNIIKAKSTKKVILKIQYQNEVPEDSFENDIYNDNKTLVMNLANEVTTNPKTLNNLYGLIIILCSILSIVLFIIFRKNKFAKILIVTSILVIPISTYALCRCDINIESNIKIKIPENGYYYNVDLKKYYSSLEPAINVASSNQTIRVIKDKEETSTVTIPSSLEGLTIDFNNHSIYFGWNMGDAIVNEGKIKLINTKYDEDNIINSLDMTSQIINNGSIEVREGVIWRSENTAVYNYGTLDVYGGNIIGADGSGTENNGTMNIYEGKINGYSYGIDNNSILNMTGGEVSGNIAIVNDANATLNISHNAVIRGIRIAIGNNGVINTDGGIIIANNSIESTTGIGNSGTINLNNVDISVTASGQNSATGIENTNGVVNFNSGKLTAIVENYRGNLATGINNLGTLLVLDGEIIAKTVRSDGLDTIGIEASNNSITTIKGGTIKALYKAIVANGNYTLTIGEDDNNISTTSPEIYANGPNGIGIYLGNDGSFNFYDGLIKFKKGVNYCIYGTASTMYYPIGYTLYKEYNDSSGIGYLIRE